MTQHRIRTASGLARLSAVAVACAALAGCGHSRGPVKEEDSSVTLNVPVLTPQGNTQATQAKGGLTITVTPISYTTGVATTTTWSARRAGLADPIVPTNDGQPAVWATSVTKSEPVLKPKNLGFLITINNQMPRVFHGTGTVVQFNVGGHLMSVDQQLYADLQTAIVPPNNQAQVKIYGPALDELPPDANSVALFVYDVVTEQNDAGVVTAKQNYQWDYALKMEPRQITVPGAVTQSQMMSVTDYQAKANQAAPLGRRARRGAIGVNGENAGPSMTPTPEQ